ncbi:MAG: 30S ribosomal protein S12 methylthiotransferase RimO, partial [Anaerovorax sp.]
FIMVNTCGFINDAKKESIDKIFEMAQHKQDAEACGEKKCLIVSGCLSERYKEELYKEMPEVDIFVGVNDYENLPKIMEEFQFGTRKKQFSTYEKNFLEKGGRKRMGPNYSAPLKIAEGCDNCCAYCVIPSIRGAYRSRKMEDILEEARAMADQGCKEIILIAQDVTGYGKDLYGEYRLAKLVEQLCKIEKIHWIRLMYCYEDRISDELIQVMAREEKVCNYIDIPIQHSTDKLLKAMNRRSTHASIMETLTKLRNAMPDIHIRTTLITGFPGETGQDFLELADFVEKMKFERLGVFSYSKEEGTPAATMKGQVPSDTKEKRKDALMTMQLDISLASNEKKIGKTLEVLVEEQEDGYTFIGRSQYDAPEIDNAVLFTCSCEADRARIKIGDFVKVQIVDAFDYDLVGELA